MKSLALLLCLLLFMLLLPPAGHSAYQWHHHSLSSHSGRGGQLQLLPLRVLRTPAVAEQHRQVRHIATK